MKAGSRQTTPTDEIRRLRDLASRGNVLPLVREVAADLLTPVGAFLRVACEDHAFLLESVEVVCRLPAFMMGLRTTGETIVLLRSFPAGPLDPHVAGVEAAGHRRIIGPAHQQAPIAEDGELVLTHLAANQESIGHHGPYRVELARQGIQVAL